MRAYPDPHKVGNDGSGSAQALTVYCNEYGKNNASCSSLEVVIKLTNRKI